MQPSPSFDCGGPLCARYSVLSNVRTAAVVDPDNRQYRYLPLHGRAWAGATAENRARYAIGLRRVELRRNCFRRDIRPMCAAGALSNGRGDQSIFFITNINCFSLVLKATGISPVGKA